MKQHNYKVGDKLDLMMIEPKKGKFPISKTKEGIICLIIKMETKVYYEYGSTWTCRIIESFENKLIIEPLVRIRTREENIKLLEINNNNYIPDKIRY